MDLCMRLMRRWEQALLAVRQCMQNCGCGAQQERCIETREGASTLIGSKGEGAPAEPQDHDTEHKQGGVVSGKVVGLQAKQCMSALRHKSPLRLTQLLCCCELMQASARCANFFTEHNASTFQHCILRKPLGL